MAKNLHRCLRDVLIIVGRAGLAQILEYSRLFFLGLDVRLGADSCKAAQRSESIVGTRASTKEHGSTGIRVIRHDALDVRMNGAVHGPVERLVCL